MPLLELYDIANLLYILEDFVFEIPNENELEMWWIMRAADMWNNFSQCFEQYECLMNMKKHVQYIHLFI